MGASPNAYGAMWAQAELRKSLGVAGARVLDRELAGGSARERLDGGTLVDEQIADQLTLHVDALLQTAAPVHVAA
jgi:chromate reductase